MTMLDVLSLVVACVAVAFGVISAVRARTAAEIAAEARSLADRADQAASAARADAAAAAEQAREARADAANALDQATRAQAEAASTRESAAAALRAAESARADAIDGRGPSETQGSPAAAVGAVRWKLEHAKGPIWVMKNDGDASADSALLSDVTQPPKYIRPDEVIPRTVDPGDHLQFRATPQRGGPPPRVRVSWRDGENREPKSKDVTLLVED
jgi:hypothetical protein